MKKYSIPSCDEKNADHLLEVLAACVTKETQSTPPKNVFDGLKSLKLESWSDLNDAIKGLGLLMLALGFYYLQAYCSNNSLPMPLSLSELPTMLTAVALSALVLLAISLGFLLFPAAGSMGVYGPAYRKVFHTSETYRWAKSFRLFLFCFGIPLGLIAAGTLSLALPKEFRHYWPVALLILGVIFLSTFSELYYRKLAVVRNAVDEKAITRGDLWNVLFQLLFFGFFWILLVLVIFFLVWNRDETALTIVNRGLVVLCVLLFVFSAMAVPPSTERLRNKMKVLWLVTALFMFVFTVIHRPTAGFVGGMALNILNIGGGKVLSVLGVDKHAESKWESQKLQLLLIAGNQMYVKVVEDKHPVLKISMDNIQCFEFSQGKIDKTATVCE